MGKSHGGAPHLASLLGDPASSPDTSVPAGYGGAPVFKERRRVQNSPSGEVYPHAYGGAPTSMRRPSPRKGSGGGANRGGGTTSTPNSPNQP
jgi:hypothetical protein